MTRDSIILFCRKTYTRTVRHILHSGIRTDRAEAVKLDVPENKLEPLRKQYQDAVRNKNNIKAAKCLAELQNLMKSAVSAGLDRLR